MNLERRCLPIPSRPSYCRAFFPTRAVLLSRIITFNVRALGTPEFPNTAQLKGH